MTFDPFSYRMAQPEPPSGPHHHWSKGKREIVSSLGWQFKIKDYSGRAYTRVCVYILENIISASLLHLGYSVYYFFLLMFLIILFCEW